mgnify:CR=1 FL=1
MAEVAIPLVGLGLLYIAKKQNGSDDDSNTIAQNDLHGTKVESFKNLGHRPRLQGYSNETNQEVDIGKIRNLDNSNRHIGNFPVESNQDVLNTVKNYPNPNCATDKYFIQGGMQNDPTTSRVEKMQNFSCKSLTGDDINGKDFKHNNMVPFFGSKVRGGNFKMENDNVLDSMQGAGSQHIKKSEQAPMFKPEENVQHAHGMPNHSDFYQSRVNPSLKVSNVKPWQEQRVAPGLAQGFTTAGSGGLNSGLEARDTWQPKTVDQLRTVNNPKLSFGGVTLGGKRAVQNLGEHGKVEKNRPDTYFVNTPERYFTTTGAEKGQTAQATQVFKPVNRVSTTREYFGDGSKGGQANAPYTTGKYEPTHKNDYDGPPVINPYANNQGGVDSKDYGKESYNILPNSRTISGSKSAFGGVNGTVKALVAPLLDMLRPTRKDNFIGNVRETGNVQQRIPVGAAYNPGDRPKTTIKEMTVDGPGHLFMEGQNSGGYTNTKQTPIYNQRDSTNYNSMGNVGNAPGLSNATDYGAAYNARVVSGREDVSVSRPNKGGMQIFNQEMNMNMTKSDGDRENNRMFVPQNIGSTNMGKSMYGEMRQPQTYEEVSSSRIDGNLLQAFKDNPYTQSLHSAL